MRCYKDMPKKRDIQDASSRVTARVIKAVHLYDARRCMKTAAAYPSVSGESSVSEGKYIQHYKDLPKKKGFARGLFSGKSELHKRKCVYAMRADLITSAAQPKRLYQAKIVIEVYLETDHRACHQ